MKNTSQIEKRSYRTKGVYTDIVKWKQDANITYKGLNNIKVEGVEDHFKCYVNNKLIFELL